MTIIKNSEENGSPYLKPMEALKKEDGCPFIMTAKDVVVTQELIHLHYLSPILILLNIYSVNTQLT